MNFVCQHCHALHWSFERLKDSSEVQPKFSRCCHNGTVSLPNLPEPPEELKNFFTGQSSNARRFREHIRQYNCALAFTSFTSKETIPSGGGGPWIWKTGYTIYHQLGTLRPNANDDPTYAQLYFYDPEDALQFRMKNNWNLERETMAKLQDMLRSTHRYSAAFLHSFEILQNTPSLELSLRIVTDPSTDQRRYNAPSSNEIAIVLPGDGGHSVQPRDIVLHNRGGDLQFIHDHHPDYAPLHYVLLFPYGSAGWTYGLPLKQETNSTRRQKTVSQVQYYSYRLHVRQDEFPTLHSGGRLFQQYVCDVWVSTDQSRLRWVEQHQARLRASLYSGLEDAIGHGETDVELANLGRRVVLPSSYIGGPRYMNQRFQDAIAVARHYRGFDLFITFTCNANWPEIKNALLPGQGTADRPDLTVRVFNMYRSALIDEITKHSLFGVVPAYVYTIEFQKRGLPHMHLLLSLSPSSRLSTADDVDSLIRATWPDPEREPTLFAIVKRCMVHGPCGRWNPKSPCMKDGKCSKGFPKPFQSETVMTNDGYPLYARPDDGRSYNVGNVFADNRWIVPYNPYVLAKSGFLLFLSSNFLKHYESDTTLI
jgi:Helitron helicase-like domain at N-terminus